MWFLRIFITTIFFSLFIFNVNSEVVKKVTLVGKELTFSQKKLDQLGAITFFVPEDANNPYPRLIGFAKNSILSRVDGRNHTLEGKLVGTGNKPAVATNANSSHIFIHRVSLINGKKFNVKRFDLAWLIDQLKQKADIVIDKDTNYRGGRIGSPDDYKIVVVNGARLRLTQDFEGYGILILTGERTDNPKWEDEDYIDDVDFLKRKFYILLNKVAEWLKFKNYRLPRVRRRLRLIMEDTASWHGVIITDLGENVEKGVDDDRYIIKPIFPVIEKVRGKWKIEDELLKFHRKEYDEIFPPIRIPKRETPYKLLNKENSSQERKQKQTPPFFKGIKKFLKIFSAKFAYAMGRKPEQTPSKKKEVILPIKRKKLDIEEKVKKVKVIVKKARYLPGGPVIILGRQSRRWHPPYPWPIREIKKGFLTPCEKRRMALLRFIKLHKRNRIQPQPGDGVTVYGAIIVSGSRPLILMGLADVFYSQEAIDMVNNCIKNKKAFSWKQWKETE